MNFTKSIETDRKLYLIIFLAAVGLFFYSNLFAQSRTIHEKTFDVSPGQLLELETSTGDVNIKTWSKNELYVKVLGNRKAEDKMEFDFYETSDGVKIKAEKEGGWTSSWFNWGRGFDLKFIIKLPEEFNLNVRTSGGDIDVTNLEGTAKLHTSGGDIELLNYSGDASLHTSGGDIVCENSGGKLDVHTSGGDINLSSANGEVYASTSGGDIELDYTGNNEGIELKTSGGDIMVDVPSDLEADVYLKTSGGRIRCDVDGMKEMNKTKSKLSGTLNGGGKSFECKTSGGDIKVRTF
ncbi:MAG: DUF4097 family beta strand repeat-containing protein [Ignavibacteria bacterium]|jgi:DUF4097 and DUF4098 domain-containing protein YvlB